MQQETLLILQPAKTSLRLPDKQPTAAQHTHCCDGHLQPTVSRRLQQDYQAFRGVPDALVRRAHKHRTQTQISCSHSCGRPLRHVHSEELSLALGGLSPAEHGPAGRCKMHAVSADRILMLAHEARACCDVKRATAAEFSLDKESIAVPRKLIHPSGFPASGATASPARLGTLTYDDRTHDCV